MRKRITVSVLTAIMAAYPMPALTQRVNTIRNVDFLNFTYAPDCIHESESDGTRVTNGSFLSTSGDSRGFFDVLDVEYGDLTGDGVEEAVVLTMCSGGGSGSFTDGYLYTLSNGRPQLLALLGMGDRAFGGLKRVKIINGRIEVVRNDGGDSGACCPEFIATTNIRLVNGRLITSRPVRRRILDLHPV